MQNMESPLMKNILICLLSIYLTGCGAGSDGDDQPQGLVDVSNVSGNYSLITSAISMSCTDGSTDTLSAISLVRTITHTNQEFVLSGSPSSAAGLTVIESDEFSGVVEPSGKFVGSASIIAQMDGIDGNLTVTYNLSGYFNDIGWSGDYKYNIYFQDFGVTCKYSTTFEGYKD